MITAHPASELLVDARNQLGECPLWDEHEQALLWTDIEGRSLYRWRAADGAVQAFPMPDRVGSFALCAQPGWLLLGLAGGVALHHLPSGRTGPITPVEAEEPRTRINDGRCDPQGRFVFGMFQTGEQDVGVGHYHRVGPDLQVERLPLPPIAVGNSLAFSPDGLRLYFTDSPRRTIWCADYRADGRIGEPQVFVQLPDDDGMRHGFADGSAVDAQGRLWTAMWGAGLVLAFDDQGREVERIALPARFLTCPVFGGPRLDQLFVTSSRRAVNPDKLAAQAGAGGVFRIAASALGGAFGRPEHRYISPMAA